MKEGDNDGELPMENPGRRDVEGQDMQGEQGDEIGKKRDRHGGAGERGEADEMNDDREIGTEKRHESFQISWPLSHQQNLRALTSPMINNPEEQVS